MVRACSFGIMRCKGVSRCSQDQIEFYFVVAGRERAGVAIR